MTFSTVLPFVNGIAFTSVLAFILFYGTTTRWERTEYGRNIMTVSIAALLLCVSGLARRHFPHIDWVSTLAYTVTAVAFAWRGRQVWVTQRRDRNREDQS